jgi:hypothetical protein
MQQRRSAAGSDPSTGLSATIKYVRCTASSAAGNGLGTMIKYPVDLDIGTGRCPQRRLLCVEGSWSLCLPRCASQVLDRFTSLVVRRRYIAVVPRAIPAAPRK